MKYYVYTKDRTSIIYAETRSSPLENSFWIARDSSGLWAMYEGPLFINIIQGYKTVEISEEKALEIINDLLAQPDDGWNKNFKPELEVLRNQILEYIIR